LRGRPASRSTSSAAIQPERTALSIEHGWPVRVQSPAIEALGAGRSVSLPGTGHGMTIGMRFTTACTTLPSPAKAAISRFVTATISASLIAFARCA
jgi:hypothetical protein